MADHGWKIAIVGGGIGGLTLGLALREQDIEADIYEQADELREVGAAVALSANATRFYEHIGLKEKFAGLAFEIDTLIYRDGRSGEVIGKHGGKPSYRAQFGAPYWGVHRADLQMILSKTLGMERIHLSHASLRGRQHREGELCRRRRRRAFDRAAMDARLRRCALLRVFRLSGNRRTRASRQATRPGGHPVLDGTGRASVALSDWQRRSKLPARRAPSVTVARQWMDGSRDRGRSAQALQGLAPGRHADDQGGAD